MLDSFLEQGIFLNLNDSFILGWGNLWRSEKPNNAIPSFFVTDFFLEEKKPWIIPEHVKIISKKELLSFFSNYSLKNIKGKWITPDYSLFKTFFDEVKKEISCGNLTKIVPVFFEKGGAQNSHGQILFNLLHSQNSNFYGYWREGEGIIGATPELLFEKEGTNLSSMALAGTKATEGELNLLENPKEQNEHEIVVNQMKKTLGPIGELKLSKTRKESFYSLEHLKTDIFLELAQDISFEGLIKILHPTAALGIEPRQSGDWLERLNETCPRKFFGAPFGVILPSGKSKTIVAIRNIQWDAKGILLGSGCGLVSESQLDQEWQELTLKREAVKAMMSLI